MKQKASPEELKPFQVHALEKQINQKYNLKQSGDYSAYQKRQITQEQKKKIQQELRQKDPIAWNPEIKQSNYSKLLMENYLKNPQASNEESKQNPIKKPEGSKCVYEEKKGLKPIKKEVINPITQGKQISSPEHIQFQPQTTKYQVPQENVTENSSVREEFTKQTVVSPTFHSSVFKLEQGGEDSAQKHCFKSVEKRNDSINGILSYENGPSFKGGEITKPCDAAPNQIAKECKKILAEHQENKNYAGFKDRMLNHQWNLG